MIKASIVIVKKNYIALLAIALAYSILEMGIMKIITPYMGSHSIMSIFSEGIYKVIGALFVFEIIRIIFLAGFIPMTIAAVRGQDINIGSFREFVTMKRFMNVLAMETIVIPIFIVGLVLLVIPGVYWFVITVLAYFIVTDKLETGTFEALSKSISITKGYAWLIVACVCTYTLISFFTSLIPVVSVVVDTMLTPLLYVILALIYKECEGK